MTPDEILDRLRATVLVSARDGTIVSARGGAGRPLGYLPEQLDGRSGVDLVDPADLEVMAQLYARADDRAAIEQPEAFPLRIVGPDGITRIWDVYPTGFDQGEGGWISVMICRSEQNVVQSALQLMIDGHSAVEIAVHLANDSNPNPHADWFQCSLVVHRGEATGDAVFGKWRLAPGLSTRGAQVGSLSAALTEAVASHGPWDELDPDELRITDHVPPVLAAAMETAGLSHVRFAAVSHDGVNQIITVRFMNFASGADANNQLAHDEIGKVLRRQLMEEHNQQALEQAARRDTITGIRNRLAFDEGLLAVDESLPSAVLFIDVDRFKRINDRFGHGTGDDVLRQLADRIVSACSAADLVARIGGDEFGVLLQNVTGTVVDDTIERIRQAAAPPVVVGEHKITVSVTVGAASSENGQASARELFLAADRQMLDRKANLDQVR